MNQISENCLKQMILVTGSDVEFVLTLGAKDHYHGSLQDRAVNNMERWGISELNDCSQTGQAVITNRFDFSVNEEDDLRAVAQFFIAKLGITDYSLNVTFS